MTAWRPLHVVVAVVAVLAAGCAFVGRASVNNDGSESAGNPNHGDDGLAISADGRFVTFASSAPDLADPVEADDDVDVFVRDLLLGTTERVSRSTAGVDGNGESASPDISSDGRYVVFDSTATNLVAGAGAGQVYRHDRNTGATELASRSPGGTPGGGADPSVSGDGNLVAFDATSTVYDVDAGPHASVYVHDMTSHGNVRVTVDTLGSAPNGASTGAELSEDGSTVAFASIASDLVAADTNGAADVFVAPATGGPVERASVSTGGGEGSGPSLGTGIGVSGDGSVVTFASMASDLVVPDTNANWDVFVRDRTAGTTDMASVADDGSQLGSVAQHTGVSGDGRFVAFQTDGTHALAPCTVLVRDRALAKTSCISTTATGAQLGTAMGGHAAVSDDGTYVAFHARDALIPGDGCCWDVYVRSTAPAAVSSLEPTSVQQGGDAIVSVTGSGFRPGSTVTVHGGGTTVNSVSVVSESQLTVDLSVAPDAATGPRHVFVEVPGTGPGPGAGTLGACYGCLTIAPRTNFVVVLVDDMDAIAMPLWDALPQTKAAIADVGTTFTNAFAPDPLCCPARSTLLTGKYAHNTGVLDPGVYGAGYVGFAASGEQDTIATRLSDAGYRTAFIGKYLNGYEKDPAAVPPGWDEWFGLAGDIYHGYGYDANHNGTMESYGNDPADYQTDVLSTEAVSFLQATEADDDQPFLMFVATTAPHAFIPPAPRHAENPFTEVDMPRGPSFNEPDVTDKPEWLRDGVPQLDAAGIDAEEGHYRRMMGSMLAVDDMVSDIVTQLQQAGELESTMLVFLSDNGYSFGAHRLPQKLVPYEESIRVPFAISGPGVPQGVEPAMVTHTDLVPTLLDYAGVAIPDTIDGLSFRPILESSSPGIRSDFLVEHDGRYHPFVVVETIDDVRYYIDNGIKMRVPTYRGLRTERYLYVQWYTGDEHDYELYDLSADPWELSNLLSTPEGIVENAALTAQLQARLEELIPCAGPSCRS